MGNRKKKSKIAKMSRFLMGYCLGFLAWVGGFHCLELNPRGLIGISTKKLIRHLVKLFLWTVEIILIFQLMVWYRNWITQATGSEISTAILVKSVAFLYIKVFWPRVFPEILPGLHVFFCPQCYQKQTFRFLPVSFQYGFFVTYLCRHCSCLVNGWGEQVFYPLDQPFSKTLPTFFKILAPIVLTLAMGAMAAFKILEVF